MKRIPLNVGSIDSLISYYNNNVKLPINMNAYEWLIWHEPYEVLDALKCKTNIPSKHDLELIYVLAKTSFVKYIPSKVKTYNEILKIYKNRKG